MTQTIYARVPNQVKKAVDNHAASSGKTLANAVSDLLERGLQATSDEQSIAELEQRANSLQVSVETLQERERALSGAYRGLAQRTNLKIGSCPSCGGSVTGRDLLVTGQCPNPECQASLSPLLGVATGGSKGGLNDSDFKLLLGALGALLAVAFFSQQGGGG